MTIAFSEKTWRRDAKTSTTCGSLASGQIPRVHYAFPTPLTRTRLGRDARRSLVQGVGPGGSFLSVGIAGARRAEESVDHMAEMADMADMAACETIPMLKIDRLQRRLQDCWVQHHDQPYYYVEVS